MICSKNSNMTAEYRISMISAYAIALLALFLPMCTVRESGMSVSGSLASLFVNTGILDELNLALRVSGLAWLNIAKAIILLYALFAAAAILFLVLNIESRAKEGAMIAMAVIPMIFYGAALLFIVYLRVIVVRMQADTSVSIGMGVIFGFIAYVYIFFRPLVYLCMYSAEEAGEDFDLLEKAAPVFQKAREVLPTYTAKGEVKCISGTYAGQVIAMEDREKIIFGRSAQECNLIVDGPKVSRKHCSLVFQKEKGIFVLEDFSSNGTLKSDGSKYKKSEELTAGSVFYLGNKENGFQVK